MFSALMRMSLVQRILIAIVLGVLVAIIFPTYASYFGLLGDLFIKALKAVAPLLVFILVLSSIANFKIGGHASNLKPIILMYVIGMLLAAFSAVIASQLFPSTLSLHLAPETNIVPPSSLNEIFKNLLLSFVVNPISALMEANFIGILIWAIALGLAFRHASESSKLFLNDCANAINYMIRLVINFAPFGIFGLVVVTFAQTGTAALMHYVHLLFILLGTMFFVALIVNPILVAIMIKSNPYPLVFKCLKESGITAFFTRSSAANIPVNLDLAKRLGIQEATANIAIPLGATINMAGASVTITILSLAAVHTLGIELDFKLMLILSIVATISACGASGVAGGSLLLIPVACGLFGISSDIAMQVVAIGMVISVLQDAVETALNSSTDVLFTAAVDRHFHH